MARKGRKLKTGERTASGRLKKPKTTIAALTEMAREKQDKIMRTVLEQPHRKPFEGQVDESTARWCENALGRLCLVQRLRKEIYDAANQYADTRRRWRAAIEAPTDLRLNEGGVTGLGPSAVLVARWRSQLDAVEVAITRAHGDDGFHVIERLVIDGNDLRPSQVMLAQNALETLVVHLSVITRRVSAFA